MEICKKTRERPTVVHAIRQQMILESATVKAHKALTELLEMQSQLDELYELLQDGFPHLVHLHPNVDIFDNPNPKDIPRYVAAMKRIHEEVSKALARTN